MKKIINTGVILTTILILNLHAENIIEERLNYKITLPDNPTKTEQYAGEELKIFLHKTYTTPITLNNSTNSITFFIGIPEKYKKHKFAEAISPEHPFGIFRDNNNIIFYGHDDPDINPSSTYKRQAGTLTAAYYFLNKYMHTDFFFPGKNGYSISTNQPIIFTESNDIPTPSFELRGISLQNRGYTKKESIRFFRRSLGNIPYWGRHDYYYIIHNKWKKRFGETDPEYFGLYNGKRDSGKYPYHLPCFSNPAVIQQITSDIISAIEANPNMKTVRLFADCPVQFCQCSNCMMMKERKYIKETKENGEMLYGIVKKIMNEVHKTYKDIQFLTQTKTDTGSGSYFKPPVLTKLGQQCTVEILVTRAIPYAKHDTEIELAEKWKIDNAKLVLKSYERYSSFKNYPIIKPHLDQNFFKLFTNKVKGTRYSGTTKNVPYSFCALNEYLQLKMLFNININIDKETEKFCSFAYPGATEEMILFYRKMESLFSEIQNISTPMCVSRMFPGNVGDINIMVKETRVPGENHRPVTSH